MRNGVVPPYRGFGKAHTTGRGEKEKKELQFVEQALVRERKRTALGEVARTQKQEENTPRSA